MGNIYEKGRIEKLRREFVYIVDEVVDIVNSLADNIRRIKVKLNYGNNVFRKYFMDSNMFYDSGVYKFIDEFNEVVEDLLIYDNWKCERRDVVYYELYDDGLYFKFNNVYLQKRGDILIEYLEKNINEDVVNDLKAKFRADVSKIFNKNRFKNFRYFLDYVDKYFYYSRFLDISFKKKVYDELRGEL